MVLMCCKCHYHALAIVTLDPGETCAVQKPSSGTLTTWNIREASVDEYEQNTVQVDKNGHVIAVCPECKKKHTPDDHSDAVLKIGPGELFSMEAATDVYNTEIYDCNELIIVINRMARDRFNAVYSQLKASFPPPRFLFRRSLRVKSPKGVVIKFDYK